MGLASGTEAAVAFMAAEVVVDTSTAGALVEAAALVAVGTVVEAGASMVAAAEAAADMVVGTAADTVTANSIRR